MAAGPCGLDLREERRVGQRDGAGAPCTRLVSFTETSRFSSDV
jgi:hypothetical protein